MAMGFDINFVSGIDKNFRNLWQNNVFRLAVIWVLTPVLALLLYTGNNGYVWGIISLVFSNNLFIGGINLSKIPKSNFGFVSRSNRRLQFSCNQILFLEDAGAITLGRTLAVVDWIAKDAKVNLLTLTSMCPGNSYAYDYLFKWQNVQSSSKMSNCSILHMSPMDLIQKD